MLSIIFLFAFIIAVSRFYQWYSEQEFYTQRTQKTQNLDFTLNPFDFEEPCIGCQK